MQGKFAAEGDMSNPILEIAALEAYDFVAVVDFSANMVRLHTGTFMAIGVPTPKRLRNIPPETLIDNTCRLYLQEDEQKRFREDFDLATIEARLAANSHLIFAYTFISANKVPVRKMLRLSWLNKEKRLGLLTKTDITDVYRKDLQIQHTTRELTETMSIVASAGLGLWHIVLEKGKAPRINGNDKFMEIMGPNGAGRSEAELYEFWFNRIHKEDLPSVRKSVKEMLAGSFSENTYRWEDPEKGTIYFRCGGTANSAEKKVRILSGYHQDVTAIVREDARQKETLAHALLAAEQANRAKTIFLSNMSHDIRTPMNAITGFAGIAAAHPDDKERVLDCLNKILLSGYHLQNLINDILDMSHIESGKMALNETPCNLSEIMQSIIPVIQPQVDAKQHKLEVDTLGIKDELVYADALKLPRILVNLAGNAVKYTPPGGTIAIKVEQYPSGKKGYAGYRFMVKDNGIGMSEEFLQRIFTPFERESTTTASGIEGTGLGLAITKNIVSLMGGRLTVQSEQGKGSQFTADIKLRLQEGRQPEPPEAEAPEAEQESLIDQDLTGAKLLVVEDNELNREIAETVLEEAGFKVETASDGSQAVEMLETSAPHSYDLVLMDVQMPVMDGYVATKAIRQSKREDIAGLPVIAMTANAFEEDKKRAVSSGMNEHIAKPLDIKVLIGTIKKFLVKK